VVCDEPIKDVILQCSAVNELDLSALESLEALNHRLQDMTINLHLSEVKGPVMDRLQRSHFLEEMTGNVYLSQWDAWQAMKAVHKDNTSEQGAAQVADEPSVSVK
jgi:SulP family sulfate permease